MMVEKIPFIMINRVSYTYPTGTLALKNITLSIDQGEMVGIMGPNGAGKTTLIRTLNGLVRPQNGIILINGENTKDKTIAQLSRTVGVIFQNPDHQLFSNTVEDEIKFSLKNIYSEKSGIQERTSAILKQFNFARYKNRSPLNLSGGEKKKLALASVVCRDPDVLIFDEPTLGQDKKEIEFFIKFIQEERDKGKTIIIITHNVEFAYDYIPRIVLMSKGSLIADGPTREILTKKELIKEASLVSPQITQFKVILEKEGIPIPKRIKTEEDLTEFLLDYLSDRKLSPGGD
ncbi:MAG: Energy-coupling factor transporter ATP-binding protein EcfA2 [Promethearchaeota archaeon]|jgi:energy-coupling factor transport system ATP-binding protein|nr:MAG: Energy-coupling factor transporter ATP-binding protein EcfA2 [Candidatus Lokiarchaeota archaeon]